MKPFHILYYSEARFLCGGHYQSVVPLPTNNGEHISNSVVSNSVPNTSELFPNRTSLDTLPEVLSPPRFESSKRHQLSDFPSFHSNYLNDTDLPSAPNKPTKAKKASKIKRKNNTSKSTTESIDVDTANIVTHKRRRN